MTRLQKHFSALVSVIIFFSLAVSVIISIILGSSQNDRTFRKITTVGLNVFRSGQEDNIDTLREIYRMWDSEDRVRSALRGSSAVLLSKIYQDTVDNDDIYCLFTDEKGKMIWASDNFELSYYDITASLNGSTVTGYISDERVTVSAVYMAPVVYGADSVMVGTVLLGYDLGSQAALDSIANSTGCENAFFVSTENGYKLYVNTFFSEPTQQEDEEALPADQGETAQDTDIPDLFLPEDVVNDILEDGTHEGTINIGGQNYLYSAAHIDDLYDRDKVLLISAMPTTESERARSFMIGMTVTVATIIIVIAYFLMTFSLKKTAVEPIVKSGELARAMENGDLHFRDFDKGFPNNEIGDFALALQDTKHTLSTYIEDITRVLDRMAEGDFSAAPSLDYRGDFERINISFDRIRRQMTDIVSSIDRSSGEVYTGSEQMSAGSQILADGTVTQAAALDELTERISSVLSRTKENAETALRCNYLSKESEKSANEQNEIMGRLIAAMNDIEQRSRRIQLIISTIDNIAFRTNILALNAAVEAARAGQAGKGFAVVADEVRNLASKSAEATRETGELITSTSEAVEEGVRLVYEATDSMNAISARVAETSRLVADISDRSTRQAQDIDQVNSALEKISLVVAKNSATAEETAASCQELTEQSRELKRRISVLKAK